MSTIGDQRSFADLIGSLSRDITSLFRKEVELAKAEARESASRAIGSVVSIIAGAVLGLGALGVLLGAAVAGLGALFVAWGMAPEGANALSAVIIGVIVAIIAWVFVQRGINGLRAENLWLDRTAHSVSRDAGIIKERVHG
jgi:hypothetical protein